MAVKAVIFGTDDLYPQLKYFYDKEVNNGNLEIVGSVILENDKIQLVPSEPQGDMEFKFAIISSTKQFYQRMKLLESYGLPRKNIIDGRIFPMPNLNFPRLLDEGVAYGSFYSTPITDQLNTIYPRVYRILPNETVLKLGRKSRINSNNSVEGIGAITFGNFSAISWNGRFELGLNGNHNHHNVSHYALASFDWDYPKEFLLPQEGHKIEIGNDVWIGRGVTLKCTNPEKPLIIGDGAAVASNSVVVKSVPPYAIVGGNPAQFIKWRFPEKIIESFLRIKWWNWDIDKIYDNFKYFNRVEEFVSMHDKGV